MEGVEAKLESILTKLLEADREDLILALMVRNVVSIQFNKVAEEDISEGIKFHDSIIQFLSVNCPESIGKTFEFSVPIAFWENIKDEPTHEIINEIRE